MENRNLVCPHCQSRMTRIVEPKSVHWACRRCGGRSSTISLMRKTMPAELINRLWQQTRHGNPPRPRACPACGQRMCQLAVAGHPFVIDICRSCTFVWFDPTEYEAMPSTPPRIEDGTPKLPPKARQMLAMEDIRLRREAARAAKKAPDELWKIVPAIFGMPVEFDHKRTRVLPAATWTIAAMVLVISVLAFLDLENVVGGLGLVPADWNRMGGFTFLTSFFIHGGLFHLLGNLYFLLVFGDNVEDDLGAAWYVYLLLVATFVGGVAHILINPQSTTPCVGASGGISGILAYYALQFPRERVGFLFFFRWIRFPVMAYVVFWVLLQILGVGLGGGNVAHGAHLGGAAAGFAFWLWRKNSVKSGT